ncbi:2Fe-2S iron-sulfur cluster-binding protein [Brevibacillus choshinensis]|uniref:2Fe-2S iron-sulfur cluster-binding protein n=1 Tax=Brevibacillus choshinensis TaxID=54911 RepID=UPI002E240A23|nr:2Fe-2S iron-sulfur cluster-binding protein [Brevibacillus choshinensis]MED4583757.1 2Fe-2S iron-sulfur cluster-binding protein [Brevibacillus choshinensis]MED4751535.1 2Fe-2S iron-sulfur cluster-binding protein [Brevibacillus choshinensis]
MRKQLTVGSLITGRSIPTTLQTTPIHTKPASPANRTDSRSAARLQGGQASVRVKQRDQVFHVHAVPRETLLSAALAQGYPVAYKCQQGLCGKCTVQLMEGGSCLSSPTDQEQQKLGSKLTQGYRLACQSTFRSTIQK